MLDEYKIIRVQVGAEESLYYSRTTTKELDFKLHQSVCFNLVSSNLMAIDVPPECSQTEP